MNICKIEMQQLLGNKFVCDCGKIHKCDVKFVEVGMGVINKTKAIIDKIIPNSNILLYAEKKYYLKYQKLLEANLPKCKVIFVQANEDVAVFENVDIAIVFGGQKVINLCRRLFTLPNLICIYTEPVFSQPMVLNGVLPYSKMENPKPPLAIIADTELISSADYEIFAGAFGYIISKLIAIFDYKLRQIINREYYCECIVDYIQSAIDETLKTADKISLRSPSSIETLAMSLIKLDLSELLLGENIIGGETQLAVCCCQQDSEISFGEYAFLASYKLIEIYKSYYFDYSDVLYFPPDYGKLAQIFAQQFASDELSVLKKFITVEKLDRQIIQYKLDKHKQFFKLHLSNIQAKLQKAKQIFYSIYFDDGRAIECKQSKEVFLQSFTLAPLIFDKMTTLNLVGNCELKANEKI